MFAAREPSDIDRFFRGLTEYAFHARLGVIDPLLIDYIALLLVRFLRHDAAVLSPVGETRETDVASLFVVAREHAPEEALLEYRHIGDYTLFWSGLYPEAVGRLHALGQADQLVDFRAAGKQAYWLVSTLEPEDATDQRLLFERLSHDYDLCVEGLAEVRRAWGDAA